MTFFISNIIDTLLGNTSRGGWVPGDSFSIEDLHASLPRIQPKRAVKTKTLERKATKDKESKERLAKKKKQRTDNVKRLKVKALKKKRDQSEIKELAELFSKMKISDDK